MLSVSGVAPQCPYSCDFSGKVLWISPGCSSKGGFSGVVSSGSMDFRVGSSVVPEVSFVVAVR